MSRKANLKNEGTVRGTPVAVQAGQSQFAEDQVRRRAYELYLARGAMPGDPLRDWVQAEQELKAKPIRC